MRWDENRLRPIRGFCEITFYIEIIDQWTQPKMKMCYMLHISADIKNFRI